MMTRHYETKTLVAVPAWVEQPQLTNTLNHVTDAYARVPLIYRALRIRCNSLIQIPFHLYNAQDNETEWMFDIEPHALFWQTQAGLLLAGAAYIFKEKKGKRISNLRALNPFTMRMEYRDNETLFYQMISGKRYPATGYWTLEDLIFVREYSPVHDVGAGVASAQVALNAGQLNHYLTRFASNFFEHGAMPVTTVSLIGNVLQSDKDRVESFFRRALSGIANSFRVLALNQDVKIQTTQSPLKDLATPELNEQARKDIARAFELPVTLLDSDETFATATQHARSYYSDTVIPIANMLAAQFNQQLFNAAGLHLEFDHQEMDIFQEDEAARASSLQALVTAIETAKDPDTLRAAMAILGYDIPQELEPLLFKVKPQPEPVATVAGNEMDVAAESKRIERAQFKKWKQKRKRPLLSQFQFKHLNEIEQAELLAGRELKSIDAVVRQFCARWTRRIESVFSDENTTADALDRDLRELLEYHVSAAYFEGLQAGGVPPTDFDAEDTQAADALVFAQWEHLDGFVEATLQAKDDEMLRASVLTRAELWCNAVRDAGNAGQNEAAQNEMVVFTGDDGVESCATCQRLKGQKHRRKWWVEHELVPGVGNPNFECGGWQCAHYLEPVKR